MYYNVSFKWSGNTYCANIAHASTEEAVRRHYSEYEWVSITPASEYDVSTARRKGMPIIECKEDK